MIDPSEFESVTESPSCMSDEIPGARSTAIALQQNVCNDCGKVRLFLSLQDADGNVTVASFDENLAAYWGMLFLNAAKEIAEINRGLGSGWSMN